MQRREGLNKMDLDKYLEDIQEFLDPITGLIAISAAAGITNAINITYRTYKEYFTKAGRACTDLSPREKSICMLQFKIKGKKEQLRSITRMLSGCTKAKKIEACRDKLRTESQKVKKDIKRMQERIKSIQRGYKKPRSTQRKVLS